MHEITVKSNVLILGIEGGSVAERLTNKYDYVKIKGVEIDHVIVELGKKYLYLDERIDIIVEDAGIYIGKDSSKYDIICVDLFFKDKASDLLNSEKFLTQVRSHLKKEGIVIINRICRNINEDNQFVEDMKNIFKSIKVKKERGKVYEQNVIFYGKV